MIESKQIFSKGINQRISKERGSSDRLQTAKNARLQKRGNTLEVSRIEGFEEIENSTTSYTGATVLDSLIYDNDLVVLSHDGTDVNIDFIDLDGGGVTTLSFTAASITYGELTLLEDTIFITPYQKVLTNVSGTWYLKDFISTTPLVEINNAELGTKATGSITITGDASPETSGVEATTETTITGAPTSSGTITVTYDTDEVDVVVDGTETIDEFGGKVETAINADGVIGITCVYDTLNDELQFEAKAVGTIENGKEVIFDNVGGGGTTGATLSDESPAMTGGEDPDTGKEGDLDFSINGTVELAYDVNYGDTKLEIANSLNDYLNTNSDIYESTVDDSGADPIINIVALEGGTPANGTITEENNTTAVTYTKDNMSGGAYEEGTLEQDEDYWYKVRYVYFDGHKTKTSYPTYRNTGNHQAVIIDISVAQDDLDGGWINVEIFRKINTSEYFLIDKITPTSTTETYTDSGRPNLNELQEENYVWAETNQTQEIVRDRLVKANNTYSNVENNANFEAQILEETVETTEQGVPYNTDVEFYTQIRKTDGTLTTHKFHENVSVGSNDSRLQIKQTGDYTPTNDFKELASYARFRPKTSEDAIAFNSVEIYNANVPSIATQAEAEVDQDKPANPHVFLGWKYLEFWYGLVGGGSEFDYVGFRDNDWFDFGSSPEDNKFAFGVNSVVSGVAPYDDVITQPITSPDNSTTIGQNFKYIKEAEALEPDSSPRNSVVYKLSFLDGLKEAVRQGKVSIKLTAINGVTGSLSTERPDDDFIGREIKVTGVKDLSESEQKIDEGDDGLTTDYYLQSTGENRVYLILESGSPFDDFDNNGANNSDVKQSSQASVDFTHRYEFDILGLGEIDKNTSTTSTGTTTGAKAFDYTAVDYDYRVRLTDYTDVENEAGTLIYKRDTQDDTEAFFTPEIQGWEKVVNNKFEFYRINTWNEYSSIVTLEDLEAFQRDYPNQLIWSQPYILESNASKVRTFDYTNVKNISGEYGEIVNIQYILGKLIVFCERGINIINVGEVLTQQVGGQTFVDSSTLLNNDFWLLKNLPDIKPKSIVQHENVLYFCDGKDVWSYSGQMNNITQGKILLDDTNDYVGGIDPRNKEYLLSDGTETFSYSIELGEWQGPYTFDIETSFPHKNNFFGVVGDNAVKFNTGNNLTDTVIESVANTLDEASITKLFRKFYLEMSPTLADGDVTFEYSKDGSTYTSVDLFDKPLKNGVYHVGINGTNKNGRQIYWKITTQKENFVLNLVSFLWDERKRR